MLDLSTTYLGFKLNNPLIAGAGPLSDSVDSARQLEDAGTAAIVLRSLFEEQIVAESVAAHRATDIHTESFGEALSYLPDPEGYALGPDEYLEHLRRIKQSVEMPVIGSLNGTTLGRWLEYGRLIEQAGADALELNVFYVPMRVEESAAVVERRTLEMVAELRRTVKLPLAVKLAPFYTSLPHLAAELVRAGADGVVLFNRFYEPDINVAQLEYEAHLQLSHSPELLLRLRWLAIVSGCVRTSLAVTGGIHTGLDVVKSVMAGANAVQLVSALLRGGPNRIRHLLHEVRTWMQEHEYLSLAQMHASMNLQRCPNPQALARGNYIHMLQTWGE